MSFETAKYNSLLGTKTVHLNVRHATVGFLCSVPVLEDDINANDESDTFKPCISKLLQST